MLGLKAGLDRRFAELLTPQEGGFDFLSPPGEPAIAAADSISWRIFANPVSVFVGGVAAVILELAEPRVRTGVWTFTSFRRDPVERMKRTGLAAMATVYGARSRAEGLIRHVRGLHSHIAGETPEGVAFRADDPDLLDWVQATASYGFIEAYRRFGGDLTRSEVDAAYAEGATAGRLYGAEHPPRSEAERVAFFEAMRPRLEASPIIFEYLAIVRSAPAMPALLAPLQRLLVRAAVELQPHWLRRRLGLTARFGLRPGEAQLVRQLGRAAGLVKIDTHPAVLARRRLATPPAVERDLPG